MMGNLYSERSRSASPATIATRTQSHTANAGRRRTLAWFIARRPAARSRPRSNTDTISIQMFEGYAGTSDSGFRARSRPKVALARGEHLPAAVEAHEHTEYTGPAADEAARRLEEFGNHGVLVGHPTVDP